MIKVELQASVNERGVISPQLGTQRSCLVVLRQGFVIWFCVNVFTLWRANTGGARPPFTRLSHPCEGAPVSHQMR